MKNKGGRPQSDNPKTQVIGVRLTAAEYEKLKEYACCNNQTISQVVTESLEHLYIADKKE